METLTNSTPTEFLFFSDPFSPAKVTGFETVGSPASAGTIARLIKNGTFALARQQVMDAFHNVGGKGQLTNLKGIVRLCLLVVAESHKTNQPVRLWFDALSGRLELECSNGLKDSLSLYPGA